MEKPDFVRYNHDSGVDVRPSLTSKVTITPAKYKIPEQQRVDRTVAGSSKRSTLRFYQLTDLDMPSPANISSGPKATQAPDANGADTNASLGTTS